MKEQTDRREKNNIIFEHFFFSLKLSSQRVAHYIREQQWNATRCKISRTKVYSCLKYRLDLGSFGWILKRLDSVLIEIYSSDQVGNVKRRKILLALKLSFIIYLALISLLCMFLYFSFQCSAYCSNYICGFLQYRWMRFD